MSFPVDGRSLYMLAALRRTLGVSAVLDFVNGRIYVDNGGFRVNFNGIGILSVDSLIGLSMCEFFLCRIFFILATEALRGGAFSFVGGFRTYWLFGKGLLIDFFLVISF